MINTTIKEYVKHQKSLYEMGLEKLLVPPKLAIVQVGDNPASNTYIKGKMKDCEEVGIHAELYKLEDNATQIDLDVTIDRLNQRADVHGIIVQLPLPKQLTVNPQLISPHKDIDGFELMSHHAPCTPFGIIKYLEDMQIDLKGKNAVIIGRSEIVGKPMAQMLLDRDCTVTICHSKTKDISYYTKNADIIVVATGHINTLTADMIGDNMPVVFDVGINRDENGKLCGDCDYEGIKDKCSFVSPVPGGVGLLTRLALVHNTCVAAGAMRA